MHNMPHFMRILWIIIHYSFAKFTFWRAETEFRHKSVFFRRSKNAKSRLKRRFDVVLPFPACGQTAEATQRCQNPARIPRRNACQDSLRSESNHNGLWQTHLPAVKQPANNQWPFFARSAARSPKFTATVKPQSRNRRKSEKSAKFDAKRSKNTEFRCKIYKHSAELSDSSTNDPLLFNRKLKRRSANLPRRRYFYRENPLISP